MASKASMLKQGVNKTGRGLFEGMPRLNAREEEAPASNTITQDIVKEVQLTERVEPQKVIQEEVIPNTTPIIEETVKTPEIVKNPVPEPIVEEVKEEAPKINETLNMPENPAKKENSTQKGTSRYEKDKFLLLDIRGYRDYVEHMAKAANMSATKYIRNLIQQDMEKNNDIYLAHKALEEKLRGRAGN